MGFKGFMGLVGFMGSAFMDPEGFLADHKMLRKKGANCGRL